MRLIKEFWDIVNNPNKTSVNVLSGRDVYTQDVDGKHIVVINNVPRAEQSYKPVYVDGNPLCIDIGERAGSGIPNIFHVWRDAGWPEPKLLESFEHPRITMMLIAEKKTIKGDDKAGTINRDDKKVPIKTAMQRNEIITYLTDHSSAGSFELGERLGVKSTRVKKILKDLIDEGIVISEGANRNRVYKLKA